MCGIAGVLSPQETIKLETLKVMADAIAHRGPDGEGFWRNRNRTIGFGHRRLAIIDLSAAGEQPMHFANERYTITFNGEIYNYLEIRSQLLTKGYQFKSNCDTEVLLALYDYKKQDCLADLDGMFAFAIWDEQEQKLFCARDRFGEKPFYFAVHHNSFYFASEIKALWAAGVPRVVNNRMLYNYLAHNSLYNPEDLSETFFEKIYKLKASHYFQLAPSDLRVSPVRYWNVDCENIDELITEEKVVETFRELFFESVKRRLRSDVPVGSSLSGGLDSSLIVCAIDKLNENNKFVQNTFSARFPGYIKDEGKYMEMVINQTRVNPHFVFPDENGLFEEIDKVFYHQEEPFGSASIYAQHCVMQLAKENNTTVLLDGQGADEILAGYHWYFADYFRELKITNKSLWRQETHAYQTVHADNLINGFQKQTLKNKVASFLPNSIEKKVRKIKAEWFQRQNALLNKDFYQIYSNNQHELQFCLTKSLRQSLFKSTTGGELEQLLRYADRNSMAHSREVRLPFLNYKLVEFLFTLPSHFKIRGGTSKYIMRRAFKDVLPEGIVNRKDKIGYEPPQQKWFESEKVREQVLQAEKSLVANGILRAEKRGKTQIRIVTEEGNLWKILMAYYLCRK